MSDIELVIKIPKVLVSELDDDNYPSVISWYETTLYDAIKNATPLPKGHGRLIDYGYVVDAIDDWINAGEYNYTNATDYLRKRIRNTPTIIEADKVESEEA